MRYLSLLVFLDKAFKFQMYVSNGCLDVLMISVNLSNIAILEIHVVEYHCVINEISKSEAINLMQNIDLSEKSGTLQFIKKIFFMYKNG